MTRSFRGLFLTLLGSLASGPGSAFADDATRLHRDPLRKIEFLAPADWVVHRCASSADGVSCLALRPPSRRNAADPAVTIEVRAQRLEEAIASHVLFEKRGREWVKQGRFGESVATSIAGHGWRGIEATASCGISDDETGFHAAAGSCLTAIVSDGARTVVIETDGFESTLDVASVITKRLRFLK